jgi:serine/threonine protein kinase
MQPKPNRIGPYTIIKKIAEGGMGEIFLVYDSKTKEQLALKRIRPDKIIDKKRKELFLNEAKTTSRLRHPSIIPIVSIVNKKGLIYYTMPFIKGETLKQFLDRYLDYTRARIPYDANFFLWRIWNIFIQVCDAMSYAHSQGYIHRDLKPSNLIMEPSGQVRILDWGLIGDFKKAEFNSLDIAGTVIYMAPEIILSSPPSIQSDIYSLGLILYEMLTLRYPFHRNDLKQYKLNLEREIPLDPAKVMPHLPIPPYLSKITQKCLEIDPKNRYQTVQQILDDLENEKKPGRIKLTTAERLESYYLQGELKTLVKLEKTPAAPLAFLGRAKIFEKQGDLKGEFTSFVEGFLLFPEHPLTARLQRELLGRFECATSQESRYSFGLLILTFLPWGQCPPKVQQYLKALELKPLFIDPEDQKSWPEALQFKALAVHLARLLNQPKLLASLFHQQIKETPPSLPIIGQILLSFIKLGAFDQAEEKLDLLTKGVLDIQAIAYLYGIQECLKVHRDDQNHFSLEVAKKVKDHDLFPIYLAMDALLKRKKPAAVCSLVDDLIMNHDLNEEQILELDCYLIQAYLLEKNWSSAEKILLWHLNRGENSELLLFLNEKLHK